MLDWSLGAEVAPLSISAQEFAFDHHGAALGQRHQQLRAPDSKGAIP